MVIALKSSCFIVILPLHVAKLILTDILSISLLLINEINKEENKQNQQSSKTSILQYSRLFDLSYNSFCHRQHAHRKIVITVAYSIKKQ